MEEGVEVDVEDIARSVEKLVEVDESIQKLQNQASG